MYWSDHAGYRWDRLVILVLVYIGVRRQGSSPPMDVSYITVVWYGLSYVLARLPMYTIPNPPILAILVTSMSRPDKCANSRSWYVWDVAYAGVLLFWTKSGRNSMISGCV